MYPAKMTFTAAKILKKFQKALRKNRKTNMRPKFLFTALENWLFENYPSMPNVLIAQELSQRIQEGNLE